MSVVPKNTVDKIAFFQSHNTPWSSNAVAIGTTTTAVTNLATLTAAAQAAVDARSKPEHRQGGDARAQELRSMRCRLPDPDIIKSIKTKAATTGDSVYMLAPDSRARRRASPMGPLGTPRRFQGGGSRRPERHPELSWKCTNPVGATGTTYQVRRRVEATGDFAYIGSVGSKKFTDDTLPAGSSQVTYQIQAVRSTAVGAWAQFNVNFGVSGGAGAGGAMTAFVTESAPAKLAA